MGPKRTALLRVFRRAAYGRPVTIGFGAEDANLPEFVFAPVLSTVGCQTGAGLAV